MADERQQVRSPERPEWRPDPVPPEERPWLQALFGGVGLLVLVFALITLAAIVLLIIVAT